MMRHKPMLAYPVSKKPIDYTDKVFIQPKLDGVRCLIQCTGDPVTGFYITAYSRTGKEWLNIDHIIEELVPFFAEHPNVILDGELYNHDLKNDFEKIISLVRKTKPTDEDRAESAEKVQFHCYDNINEEYVFEERMAFIYNNLEESYCIVNVPTTRVFKHEEALNVHNDGNLKDGYEGSIVRLNTEYQCKRSHSLRKFKDFSDAEATIVGYEEGKGKREGTLGKFMMQDEDGNKFGCPPGKGYNYQDMRDMLNNIHEYMGQTATFTYFERTKANSYRHPLFKSIRNYE